MYLPRKVSLGALYLRKSRQDIKFEKRTGEDTLENQRILMHNFLSSMNIPYKSFEEIVSASSIEKRRQIQRIIKAIEAEEFDTIIVKDISRLSRGSQKDAGFLYELFIKHEILIITPSKVYDCTNRDDLKMLRMEMFLYHEEWQIIRERMVSGRKLAAERGFYIGGIVPYGFKVDQESNRLVLDEEQSKVVRDIFDYYVNNGFGYRKIANILNENKIPSPKGTLWVKSTIKRILENEKYSGIQVYGKRKLKGDKIKYQPEETWIKSEMNHQLIDADLFKQAQDKSEISSIPYDPDTYHSVHPLSKLITCGVCGKNIMRKHTKSYYTTKEGEKRTYSSYVLACCHGYIKYDKVLDQLINLLEEYENIDERLLQKRLSKHIKELTATSDQDIREDIEEIQKRIKKIQKHRLELYSNYAEKKMIDEFIYQTKNNEYVKQVDDLEVRLDQLKKMQKEEKKEQPKIDMKQLQNQIRSVLDVFETLESPYQNKLLHFLFESVTLHITERKKGTHSNFALDVVLRLPFSR